MDELISGTEVSGYLNSTVTCFRSAENEILSGLRQDGDSVRAGFIRLLEVYGIDAVAGFFCSVSVSVV